MSTVALSETAVKEIKRIVEEQKLEASYLRVGISGGGCSGFSYSFGFADDYDPATDSLLEQDGLKIVVDKMSALYLDGTTVGFHEGLDKRGFTFENPNVTKTCGCGSSFSA